MGKYGHLLQKGLLAPMKLGHPMMQASFSPGATLEQPPR